MKRLLAIGALLTAPLGCVSNQGDSSIRFLGARLIRDEGGICTAVPNTQISSGLIDIAAGTSFLIAPSVETNVLEQVIKIGQDEVSGPGLNDITLTELVYSYQVVGTPPPGLSIPADEIVPVYVVFRPNTNPDESFMFLFSLGPRVMESLFKYYITDAEAAGTRPRPSAIVTATIKGRGYMSSGRKVESNLFAFPTTVRDFLFPGCPVEQEPVRICDLLGQNGSDCRNKG